MRAGELDVEEYLNSYTGYGNLSEDEKKAVSNFALTWSLFESKLLDKWGSPTKIKKKSEEWVKKGTTDDERIEYYLKYFKSRYVHGVTR